MLSVPFNATRLKRSFFSGKGTIGLSTKHDVWKTLFSKNEPFTRNVDKVVDLSLNLTGPKKLKLGSTAFNLEIDGGVAHHIRLVWPGEESTELDRIRLDAGDLLLEKDHLYVLLYLATRGNASAKGNYGLPAGVNMNFGIGAGGHADYWFLKRVDIEGGAREALSSLFKDMLLPQQVKSRADVPSSGDVAVTQFGGYLKLNAGLTWGYSTSGSKSFEPKKLGEFKWDIDYALKLSAAISVGYEVAGEFEIQARRGREDGWARFIVRKSRDSPFAFAADIGASASFDMSKNFTDNDADDFIAMLAGADAKTILNGIAQARELGTLSALEQHVNKLAMAALDEVALKWMDRALDSSVADEFFQIAAKVVNEYESVDNRVIQIYEEYLGKIPLLKDTLDALSNLEDPASLKALLNQADVALSADAWRIIDKYWKEGLFDLLSREEELEKLQRFIKEVSDFLTKDATQNIRDFVETVKTELKVKTIFGKLQKIDSAGELRALTDERLQAMVGELIGRPFTKLKNSEFNNAFEELHEVLNKIEDFKIEWFERFARAATQQFNATLSYEYTRAKADAALIDVEINLMDAKGRQLADRASKGDFQGILKAYRATAVRFNTGVLTHRLTKSSHLKVNLLGWKSDRLRKVVLNAKHSIEEQKGGLLHVFSTDASLERRKSEGHSFTETVASTFLLRTIVSSFQEDADASAAVDANTKDYVARILNNMTVEYDRLYDGQVTRPEELTHFFEFARSMGLMTHADVAKTIGDWRKQFPEGLGHVRVSYDVRYKDDTVRSVFRKKTARLVECTRKILREFVGAIFITPGETDERSLIGLAYRAAGPDSFDGSTVRIKSVTLPSWLTDRDVPPRTLSGHQRAILKTLFQVENRFVTALEQFDEAIDKLEGGEMPARDLNEAIKKFVNRGSSLEGKRENSLFTVFDGLVHLDADSKPRRESSMLIEITPPGAERPVRKVIQAAL